MATDYHSYLTNSTLLHTGKGILAGLVISVESSSAVTLTLYDNTAASGTVLFRVHVAACSAQQPFTIFFAERFAPRFETGLYVKFSTDNLAALNLWAVGY